MPDKQSPFEFPCSFPLKVMGKDTEEFAALVRTIVRKYIGELDKEAFVSRLSEGGKYISITITFMAQSQGQLDALYEELSHSEHVLMML